MSKPQFRLSHLDPQQHAELHALTRPRQWSWPTIALWVLVVGGYASSYLGSLAGWIPLWLGCVVNSALGYFAFTIVHDSIHRAICRNKRLNDWIGQSAVSLGAPYISLELFRWAHLQHHRFANGPGDPDTVLHGPAWSLPLRWMVIDLWYLRHVLRSPDPLARQYLRRSLPLAIGTALLFGALLLGGYGWHLLMLWFIPSRLLFIALGFAFFWLPHVPHDTPQADNFTQATTVRIGHEWLLGPALQAQNYHLIHHLYPTTPFYNNYKVWKLLEPELRGYDLSIQRGFAIQPERLAGRSTAAADSLSRA